MTNLPQAMTREAWFSIPALTRNGYGMGALPLLVRFERRAPPGISVVHVDFTETGRSLNPAYLYGLGPLRLSGIRSWAAVSCLSPGGLRMAEVRGDFHSRRPFNR